MPLDKSLLQNILFLSKVLIERLCIPKKSDESKSETLRSGVVWIHCDFS